MTPFIPTHNTKHFIRRSSGTSASSTTGFAPTSIVTWLRRVFTFRKRALFQHQRGFTLVELMVSVSILAVISAIVFANHASFRSSISLTNLAYDIALSVRETQSYGINSRGDSGGFGYGYGIRFRSDQPTQYLLYVDIDGSKTPGSGEALEWYNVGEGNYISQICLEGSFGEYCSDSGTVALNIVYQRPDPEAVFKTNIAGVTTGAVITVSAPDGGNREIVITSAGQVSVSR